MPFQLLEYTWNWMRWKDDLYGDLYEIKRWFVWWVDKNLDGSDHDLYEGNIPTCSCAKWGKPWGTHSELPICGWDSNPLPPECKSGASLPFQPTHSKDGHISISISISGVITQGDPCTMTNFWSIVRPHLLYSTSSPIPLTKYIILHNVISS
jgi:hypothetical protein